MIVVDDDESAGRLENPQQVFDLTMADLERGLADPGLDLRALAEEHTRFWKKLDQVRAFSRIIDSRGKVLQAPRKEVWNRFWGWLHNQPAGL